MKTISQRIKECKRVCLMAVIMLLGGLSVCAQDYVALTANSRVRTRPTVKSPAVEGQWGEMVLQKGEVLRVVGESGEWYNVIISGYYNTKGYVMKKFCTAECAPLPAVLPKAEGEESVSVIMEVNGNYWLKHDYNESLPLLKGVLSGNMLIFPYTRKQLYGDDYVGENTTDIKASFVNIGGTVYAREYTRND